ncbi:hypothetical protein EW145_g54 [Phellinidium pouzarii]|uniref:CAF17 C-terminal domain-containing protein n=1 Tax=Phellinidium pouzarii TaxID=167371 RepID=A0A4S4LK08_9AGAM|nr:hypothetical protein EW145_g54 [Phellinidium pouzarii]
MAVAALLDQLPNPPRGPFFSAFLSAQGRILHDVFVYPKKNTRRHDGYLIEYDSRPSEAPPLQASLERFILRSKVKIEDVSNQYDVWSVWGSESTQELRRWSFARSGVIEPQWGLEQWPWFDGGKERLSLRDSRAMGMGKRVVVNKGDKPEETATHDTAEHDAYTLHRILHGIPEGIIDMPPTQAFPMESNLDIMGGLDFRKGCYVGQELTVRTYHTGVVRKRILPVQITKSDGKATSPEEYLSLVHSDVRTSVVERPDGLSTRLRGHGKLLSIMQGVGLALMRLEHVDMAERGLLEFRVDETWDISHWRPSWWPKQDRE